MEIKNSIDNIVTGIKQSYSLKMAIVFVIMLILMIPQGMISSLIYERENRGQEAINEVSDSWATSQIVSGPIITIPYKSLIQQNNQVYSKTEYAYFMPETLNVTGKIFPEVRSRGIYDVSVYKSDININGEFLFPDFKDLNIDNENILWNEAHIDLRISDVRGIEKLVTIKLNDTEKEFSPGVSTNEILKSGISTAVNFDNYKANKLLFNIPLALKGSETVQFVPVGKTTKVSLQSTWSTPSFFGSFLPKSRNISDQGFEANWEIFHLNRNFPQKWKNEAKAIENSAFGVKLYMAVDQYQKTSRTIKYAILVVLLTFLAFFFLEVSSKIKIHPFQYLLVGLALILFYSLLLSLSEHISFNYAYIISGISTIALISAYVKGILKRYIFMSYISILLLVFYSFIFVILQLEDLALLVGNIGLFIVMAIVMYLSRKIDWYRENF